MVHRKQAPRKASSPLPDTDTEEKQPLRRSRRLKNQLHSRDAGRDRGDQKPCDTHQPVQIAGCQHNLVQKRTRSMEPSQGTPPTRRRKTAPKHRDTRRPKPVKTKGHRCRSREHRLRSNASSQAADNTSLNAEHIQHWAQHSQWPHSMFEPDKNNGVAGSQKFEGKRATPLRKEASEGPMPSSTSTSGIYKQKNFPELLKSGMDNIKCFMHDDEEESSGADARSGPTDASQALCHELESKRHKPPSNSRFFDDAFLRFRLKKLIDENEMEISSFLGELACPFAWDNTLAYDYSKLFEHKNETWINQPALIQGLPAPKPDYCVGYSRKAFSKYQLARLDKAVGNKRRIKPLRGMYFPFLTCEAQSYAEQIIYAERQNAYSMMLSIYVLLDLFRGAHREQTLHREILGFSVSYDHELVHVYGHYPVMRSGRSDGMVDIFQTEVCAMRISPKDLGNRWKSWNFVRNIYEIWAPKHLERLCAAIDSLDPDWGINAENETTPMSQPVGLL